MMREMDPRVRRAVLEKIEAVVADPSEVRTILKRLDTVRVSNDDDFALGIALGRIYNSFHYQSRRTLKRNATEKEFAEFLEILRENAAAVRAALERR
jgi:hypothetical protein